MFGTRLTPLLNLLADEAQAAYKPTRSTRDVLSPIENDVKQRKTNHPILIDLSKAFGCIERRTLWAILYEKGLPRRYKRALQQGPTGTQLRPKLDGQLGGEINNEGVSQGSPLSAPLLTIYFDATLQDNDNVLPGKIEQAQQETYGRNEFGGVKSPHTSGAAQTPTKSIDPNPQNYMNQAVKL